MSAAHGSEALVSLLELFAVLVVSAVGTWWLIRRERRTPTSYTRSPEYLAAARSREARMLAEWRAMPASEQAKYDAEVIEATAAAEDDARAAAEHLVERRAIVNVQFHP